MIKVLLWDVDGTILNFLSAESYAIKRCFSVFGLGECSDEAVARYSAINSKYWEMLERGEIEKKALLSKRFEEFFKNEGIALTDISCFVREYASRLGEKIFFNDDAYLLLNTLKTRYRQYVVTNGTYAVQTHKLAISGLDKIFDGVFISDEIGYEKPNIKFFEHVFQRIENVPKSEIMIIGDSLTGDMRGGNNAGIKCCWYNPYGKTADKTLKIDYEISNLNKIKAILEQ